MKTDKFKQSRPYLPLKLQLFAEPPADPTPPADPLVPPVDPTPPADPTPPVKTYTQEELEDIIKQRLSREKKATEKAIEEAKKLAKMNEDEKAKYEMDKLKEELADLKRKDAQYGLSKEASKMLAEKGVAITEKLLSRMVGETAEETSEYINDYAESVLFGIAEGVKKALSGTAPKMNVAGNQAMTKEQFNKLSYPDRMELFKTNPTLYNQLK